MQKAIFDLRQIPSKEKLEELIKDVEQMDLTGYTEESAGKVESALEFAKKVAFDENATSADVRKASDMLRAAVQGLEEKSESGTTPDKPESGNQKENPKEQSSVKTGDNNSMIVWLAVAVSMLVVLMERKRKEKR